MLKDRKDIYTRKGRAYIFGPDFSYGRPAQIFLTAPTGEWLTMVRRESTRCPGNKSDARLDKHRCGSLRTFGFRLKSTRLAIRQIAGHLLVNN